MIDPISAKERPFGFAPGRALGPLSEVIRLGSEDEEKDR